MTISSVIPSANAASSPFAAGAFAVPTPGGVGSYHFACKIGLSRFFGVPDALAGAIALVSHFLNFVPITILGLILLWREGLSASRLKSMTQADNEGS